MTFWILTALALYFIQTLLPVALRYKGSPQALTARDTLPEASILCGRAERALANMIEAMVLFIPLALLSQNADGATQGAMIFVFARIAYVPLYLSGVPVLRTLIWAISLAGLLMMALAL